MSKTPTPLDWFILNLVPCPNCTSQLVSKPVEKQWENVFCTTCSFACRFITVHQNPDISKLHILPDNLKKILKDNTLLPPLIIDYKWNSENIKYEKVIFFPFISSKFLKEQQEYPVSLIPDEETSILFEIQNLPSIILYEQPSIEDMAEVASKWDRVGTSSIQRMFKVGYAKAVRIKDLTMILRRQRGIEDVEDESNDLDEDEDDE